MTAPTSTTTPEDFLSSGGARSAKFTHIGHEIGGTILDQKVVPQIDYDTDEPKVYKDTGKPVEQLRIIVQSQEIDPEDPQDDGRRAFYVRGQMKAALGEAMRESNAKHGLSDKAPKDGGQLFFRYTEDRENPPVNGKPRYPTKVKVARYVPPANSAEQFMATPEAPPATEPTYPCPPGVDRSRWVAMTDDQKITMYQALGMDVPAARGADEPPF